VQVISPKYDNYALIIKIFDTIVNFPQTCEYLVERISIPESNSNLMFLSGMA